MNQDIDTGAGYQEGGPPIPATGENVAPDPKPEAKPEAKPDDKQEKRGDPLTALVQARMDKRDATAGLRQELDAVRGELAALRAPQQPTATPEPFKNPHDPTEQPMDFLRAEIEAVKAQVADATASVGADLQARDQVQALADYEAGVVADLRAGAVQAPVLAEAHAFIVDQFAKMAAAQGATGADAVQRARTAMLQGYLTAQQAGKDAVTACAEMAMAMGFQSEQKTVDPNPTKQQEKRGQLAAEQTLGGATGGAAQDGPDITTLSKMTREDLVKNNKAGLNQIKRFLSGQT